MASIAWLAIPVAAALFAAVWAAWSNRTRHLGDGQSLAGYQRFVHAMEHTSAVPTGAEPRRRRLGRGRSTSPRPQGAGEGRRRQREGAGASS
ncbi:hypothetical protein [Allostreptomyces psammosilenae]|uniref:Uncharacterized protein n=1 Tax=Allostreptomyces psammosilenae TaxID=1892865 RepID=A0A853A016_9ACTN|nr:hypothetical protein [Allostreptomyces psammosilenae]NYI06274.1 hypothetical protein [Allostreptomyces psammosilenae]